MQNKNKTVVRSMDLLNLFLTETRLNINDIVRLSGIPKTSVLRMLGSLEDMGFLDKNKDGYYTLGLLFLQFGNLVAERLDIRHVALPEMEKLRDELGEAVHLVIRDGWESRYIEKLDTHHPVRLFTKIGRKAPLYAGASSRIILAFMPEEERREYMDEIELAPIGSGTITSKEKLQKALEWTRENGYSFSLSELENYTAELSAPIFDHNGQIAAALSIAGLDVRFGDEHMPELISRLQESAENVSRKLGWSAPLSLHIQH
ncbi:IclR family transcriptional regulator C-terminal domain-containing protein [Paenibacillus sp. S150]|uniref:IclR family transcriptional regulator n=1 Tax=Paenibacillus sp. S150 TaxID=2749826 RepID=UPI001C593F1E|nr:IclR family transcriptional regulator C-terminal domain-containing protein [Paenibacillus sp. S150]MBW4084566.1 IclR family transcriptional regulator [Paenibacillus sp. S150]